MSSNAAAVTPAAATKPPASKKKSPSEPIPGFDSVAERLLELFHSNTRNSSISSIRGVISTAFKSLQTSFTGGKGRKRNIDSTTVTPSLSTLSPSAKKIRRSAASSSRPAFAPSPIKFRGYDIEDSVDSNDPPNEDVFNIPRHDEIFQPLTSASKGVRRLAIKDILRLDSGDEFILFLPPFNKNDKKVWRDTSNTVLGLMRRIIMSSFSKTTTPQERDAGWKNHLISRQRERDGNYGYEFNVRVAAYPSRDFIEKESLPTESVEYLVNPASGAGLTLELLGYGTAVTCHIKLALIPFIEVYIPVKDSDAVIEELSDFTNSTDDDTVYTSMAKLLLECKGDTYSYANILLTYYKRALKSAKSTNRAIIHKHQSANDDTIFQNITAEVDKKKIDLFAKSVDDHCYQCLKSIIGFDYVRRSLILDEDILSFYRQFQASFPTTHRIFHSIVSSQHFNEKHETDSDDLHRKQRLILFLFLASIRCKSVFLMKSWAIIEPLGLYYKGQQQLSAKTFSGAFSMSLPTSLAALDKLYKENINQFYAKLRKTKVICGAFDNYQQNFEKKNKTEHKSSLMQRGTSFYLKEVKNLRIVRGSIVRSKHGLIFNVSTCRPQGENWYVEGIVYKFPSGLSADVLAAERNLIQGGMLLPLLGWTVIDMPGLSPLPTLDFFKQNVPPPRLAWISADASNSDLVFGTDRKLRQPTDDAVKAFETKSMHELVSLSQRMILLNSIGKRIHNCIEKAEDSVFNIGSTEAESEFVSLMKHASSAMDRAAKFETDLIGHLNPLAHVVDKIFIFPLSPHCETSHEGMKMVYSDLCQYFQLVHVDEKIGGVTLQSSAKDQKVFLCVDALSAKQFRVLYLNLTKKLSELGSTDSIMQLLLAYELFVVQHDYLHEHRMHRQDVIWRQERQLSRSLLDET